jgi:hypothetical protein
MLIYVKGKKDALKGKKDALKGKKDALKGKKDALKGKKDALKRKYEILTIDTGNTFDTITYGIHAIGRLAFYFMDLG